MKRFAHLLATCFYVGYFPKSPGTVASALTALVLFFIPYHSVVFDIGAIALLLPVGIAVSQVTENVLQTKDPSIIVIDELLGMYVSVLFVPKTWWLYMLAFGLFRLLDIAKPFPVNKMGKIPGGFGVVLDDVIAGGITGLVVYLIMLLS